MKKILIGCGVALGLAVLGTVLASVLALRYFRTTMPDAAHLEERQEELVDRFGRPQDYLPPLDGRLEPARIETFLRVLLVKTASAGFQVSLKFVGSASCPAGP